MSGAIEVGPGGVAVAADVGPFSFSAGPGGIAAAGTFGPLAFAAGPGGISASASIGPFTIATDPGGLSLSAAQRFSTAKIPETQLALYTLTIRYPGAGLAPYVTYTFPISPSSLRKSPSAMAAIYDTAGPSQMRGVQRTVDAWGMSPPNFVLEGTTGWDRHQTDGLALTGLQSIQKLQAIFNLYAELNQAQMAANNPYLYTLEFYDYFNEDFWQVEPIGEQEIRQSERAPKLQYYRLRFAGIRPVAAPPPDIFIADPILGLFAASASVAAQVTLGDINLTLAAYS
jgi:hypothetical protein